MQLRILFARINSFSNLAEKFLGFGACLARCLFTNRTNFDTDREPLLSFPNVALNDKRFPALADEHSKSGKFCVSSKVLT